VHPHSAEPHVRHRGRLVRSLGDRRALFGRSVHCRGSVPNATLVIAMGGRCRDSGDPNATKNADDNGASSDANEDSEKQRNDDVGHLVNQRVAQAKGVDLSQRRDPLSGSIHPVAQILPTHNQGLPRYAAAKQRKRFVGCPDPTSARQAA
jgi:hypothetical protein